MPQRIKAVLKAKGGPTRYQQGVPNKVASECTCSHINLNEYTHTYIYIRGGHRLIFLI